MPVPSFQEFMLPLLQLAKSGKEYSLSEARPLIAKQLKLTEQDLRELLPSGKQSTFANRLAWARSYLSHALLLESPARGRFKITQRGLELLATNPNFVGLKVLGRYPEFLQFHSPSTANQENKGKAVARSDNSEGETTTPEEQLENCYQELRKQLAQALLEQIIASTPDFFEQLVVDLLVSMGYGGSRADAGQALGKSGDGGIDGIIKEDRLGLDIVYLQAKKWALDKPVPSSEVRDFTGSLEGHGAHKGVFITTSRFTKDALEFVSRLRQKKIVLIDGEKLTQLMIDFDVGVSNVASYTVKRLDPDYFELA